MNRLNTEKLISLVSNYPLLYDAKHRDYGDLHKRDAIWQQIAGEMGVKADVCKAKWNILRGGYRRALRNRESGCTYSHRKWRFEDDLSFLKDCVMERRRHTTRREKGNPEHAENPGSDNDEEFTIIKEEPAEVVYETLSDNVQDDEWTSSCGSVGAAEVMKLANHGHSFDQKNDSGVEDGLKQFFLSLADTVKTLPPLVQAHVKAEVFRAVNSAEVKFLQERNRSKEESEAMKS